jgi:hypothetical protein
MSLIRGLSSALAGAVKVSSALAAERPRLSRAAAEAVSGSRTQRTARHRTENTPRAVAVLVADTERVLEPRSERRELEAAPRRGRLADVQGVAGSRRGDAGGEDLLPVAAALTPRHQEVAPGVAAQVAQVADVRERHPDAGRGRLAVPVERDGDVPEAVTVDVADLR